MDFSVLGVIMPDKKLITPRKLQGFWELMPNEEILFEDMLNKIKFVFSQNCFLPLDTPDAEYSEVLLAKSGGDLDKEIYRFEKGSTDMCLRYDLTVPLARFVAMNFNVLEFPFKRFQVGKVYRGERPQKGRFREFYQCDADIIGVDNLPLTCDAECIKLYEPCLKALNLDCVVEISNRKILAGYFESLNNEAEINDLMIIVDKIEKLPREEIVSMFKEKGLNDKEIENIFKIVMSNGSFEEIYQNVKDVCDNATFMEGLNELKVLSERLKLLNMSDSTYKFNLSIVRGHNYYTGTVFEVYIQGKRSLGAIGGGGRYDNLCGYFIDKNVQGVGMSIGITRLFDIMRTEGMLNTNNSGNTDLGIITFDETFKEGLKLMTSLRENGIKADCIGENKSFKAKMKEANSRQWPYILILGENEVATKNYTIKNMETAEQKTMTLNEIVDFLKTK